MALVRKLLDSRKNEAKATLNKSLTKDVLGLVHAYMQPESDSEVIAVAMTSPFNLVLYTDLLNETNLIKLMIADSNIFETFVRAVASDHSQQYRNDVCCFFRSRKKQEMYSGKLLEMFSDKSVDFREEVVKHSSALVAKEIISEEQMQLVKLKDRFAKRNVVF